MEMKHLSSQYFDAVPGPRQGNTETQDIYLNQLSNWRLGSTSTE